MGYHITCDGCDLEEKYEMPELPKTIFYTPVVIASLPYTGYYLCNPCIEKLKAMAIPKDWPRKAAPVLKVVSET